MPLFMSSNGLDNSVITYRSSHSRSHLLCSIHGGFIGYGYPSDSVFFWQILKCYAMECAKDLVNVISSRTISKYHATTNDFKLRPSSPRSLTIVQKRHGGFRSLQILTAKVSNEAGISISCFLCGIKQMLLNLLDLRKIPK